jgi:8-oxo-dGTP diphosphatase
LYEKLGIKSAYIEQLYTFSKTDRDPRMRIVSVSYIAIIPYPDLVKNTKLEPFEEQSKEQLTNPNASNKKTGLFDCYTGILNDIDNLGFDHGEIVKTALTRIANKIEYTDIAFEFLPDKNEFTLSELCEIYIAIGAKPNYDIPNLRRFIKKRYIDTKKIIITGNKKPAKGVKPATYSLNKNL